MKKVLALAAVLAAGIVNAQDLPKTQLTVVGGPLAISSLAAHQLSLTVD